MTLDNHLINKRYYETLLEESDSRHPVQILGEKYFDENQNDLPELSSIRFAQGEIYFLFKDYESAIFKWENINNELASWAQKNMADAYMELELLSTAEELYKSITSESSTLNSEVALQLFSLYIDIEKIKLADGVIKKAVQSNPDYPNVTKLARAFFEEHEDWKSAVDLALQEAIRTQSLHWFEVLKNYIDCGYTCSFTPSYFSDALTNLFHLDEVLFENMATSLWNSYKGQENYKAWIIEFNAWILSNLEDIQGKSMPALSSLYEESYFHFLTGGYYIKELTNVIPNLLSAWVHISDSISALFASSAALSWDEIFPGSLNEAVIEEATLHIKESNSIFPNMLDNSLELFDSIVSWASKQDLNVSFKQNWHVRELLELENRRIVVAGTSEFAKAAFINSIIGESFIKESINSLGWTIKDNDEFAIHEINDKGTTSLSSFEDSDRRSIMEVKLPNSFLNRYNLSFIYNPNDNDSLDEFQLADSLLFVMDAGAPFTEEEYELLVRIQEISPNLPIHFVLNTIHEQTYVGNNEVAALTVREFFPSASVIKHSSLHPTTQGLHHLGDTIQASLSMDGMEEYRTLKIFKVVGNTLKELVRNRMVVEDNLEKSIQWNEEMVGKLNGAINQVKDLEKDHVNRISSSYYSIKDEIKQKLIEEIPKLIRDCSDIIKEESNFGNIHLELNDEMNNRVQFYLQTTILPETYRLLHEWIEGAKEDLTGSQYFLNDMAEGFNNLYKEDRLKLNSDFKILDDWRRDADRLTTSVHMEKVKILLRHTPSQVLLKSAGKLFSAISQNQSVLYNKYKKFVETEDYHNIAVLITNKFLQKFELFEQSLERDISISFREPTNVLIANEKEAKQEIEKNKKQLSEMRKNPHQFEDPITLFKIRLRQSRFMLETN
ncbi:tetratricopeptide repeat protein [Peribacillus alkalitolerans]|uniref:tetratricopeptide repeat protein n=1 Tax=Peribacillus alkalitolerans TaxID=1550385 RepID=UPI0013D5D65D|nr:GTP-binding protein [Peribacillus alkalitolerans]